MSVALNGGRLNSNTSTDQLVSENEEGQRNSPPPSPHISKSEICNQDTTPLAFTLFCSSNENILRLCHMPEDTIQQMLIDMWLSLPSNKKQIYFDEVNNESNQQLQPLFSLYRDCKVNEVKSSKLLPDCEVMQRCGQNYVHLTPSSETPMERKSTVWYQCSICSELRQQAFPTPHHYTGWNCGDMGYSCSKSNSPKKIGESNPVKSLERAKCRRYYGTEQKEKWCRECRSKKRCSNPPR